LKDDAKTENEGGGDGMGKHGGEKKSNANIFGKNM
jgi:hypothetical protein